MARITGVSGIFFKCADPKSLAAWYREVLGVAVEAWNGAIFPVGPEGPPHVVWSPFASGSEYFAPSKREFMINFAVDNLDGTLAMLAHNGVDAIGRDDSDPNGKFAWLLDPEGRKIELWEPKR